MNKFLIVAFVALSVQLISAQTLNKDVDCKCKLPTQPRIVGSEILKYPIPFMVSFQNLHKGIWYNQCGGTVINHRFIMTSAHCSYRYKNNTDEIRVRVGISDSNAPENASNTFKVKKIILHTQYSRGNPASFGDISIIELDRPLEFNQNLQPGCLSTRSEKYTDKPLQAIGYGRTSTFRKGPYGFNLLKPNPKLEAFKSNKLRHAYFDIDESLDKGCGSENGHLICGKPIRKANTGIHSSLCLGDTGSPLLSNKDGYSTVVGIAQYFNGVNMGRYWEYCKRNSFFARISKLIPFIQDVVGSDYCARN